MQRWNEDARMLTEQEYARALELWPAYLPELVQNLNFVPHWIGVEDRFWFKLESRDGHRFRLVDAKTGSATDAFDHAVVAAALRACGLDAQAHDLPLSHFEFSDDGLTLAVITPKGGFRVDLVHGTASPHQISPATEVAGPDGEAVFLREHNLWLRNGQGHERALTNDGSSFDAWGVGNDYNTRRVATNRGEIPPLPTNIFWSPNGRTILAEKIDERDVEPYPYIEFVPADGSVRPKLHFIRETLVGEVPRPDIFAFIDVDTGERVALSSLPEGLRLRPDLANVWWSHDCSVVYMVALNLDASLAALVAFNVATGGHTIIYREQASTYFDFNTYLYNLANVRLCPNGREFIWYSQQDGWGHLYAIDKTTGVVRRLTQGDWAVADIVAVTEHQLFFTAVGREDGRHPYYRHLYRIDLHGAEPNAGLLLLTPDDADHGFPGEPTPLVGRILRRPAGLSQMSPSGRYFVDAVSRVDLPPRFLLRDADGSLICEIARADITKLEATGWKPPEIFSAKGADGEIDIYGVLVKPRSLDPDRCYPVIENIYGGPQILAQPRSFLEGLSGAFMYGLNTLAEFGFIVAVLDGPGTPYRSKSFHDLLYGASDRWGIAHHRAALEGAAASRPWMDLTRVGVRGHSFGGYGAVQAMLHEPEFYKVGISSAGIYDLAFSPSGHENYLGLPDYGNGRNIKDSSHEVAPNHLKISPSQLADRLQGRLLLAAGDLDENIQPAGMFALTDALIKAGKSFDQLVLPGRNHGFSGETYFQKRNWDYFVEHLQGRTPLRHFKPDVKPGARGFI